MAIKGVRRWRLWIHATCIRTSSRCRTTESGTNLLEGDFLVIPSAKPRHQRVVGNVFALLRELQEARKGGVYTAPLDVVFDRHNVFEPDVLFIRAERIGIVTDKNVSGPPDLVVEVLSDSTRDVDLGRKLRAYSRFGVGEYWAIDPDADTAQVFRRVDGALVDHGTLGHGDELTFLGVALSVRDILVR